MNPTSLPMRIGYAFAAFILSAAAAFHAAMAWLPQYAANHPEFDTGIDGYQIFKASVALAAAIALSFAVLVLILPGLRHRKRTGRPRRIAFAAASVLLASILFAAQAFGLRYDLLLALWLVYPLAFSFVRYGILDDPARPSPPRSSAPPIPDPTQS